MLNFLLYLAEGQAAETTQTTQVQYSLFEIIFWYSAFAITVILTIFLLTHRKTNRKKMEALVNKVNNEIKAYDNFLTNPKIKFKDLTSKTILILSAFDNIFMELKDKTRVSDFDNLIKKQEEIISSIRKLDVKKSKNINQDVENIKQLLIELKNDMESVKTYLN